MKQAQGHPYHVSSDLVNRNKVGKYFTAAFVNSSFLWFSPNLCWCQHKYFEENHLRLILLVRADRVNLLLVFNRLQTLQEKQGFSCILSCFLLHFSGIFVYFSETIWLTVIANVTSTKNTDQSRSMMCFGPWGLLKRNLLLKNHLSEVLLTLYRHCEVTLTICSIFGQG